MTTIGVAIAVPEPWGTQLQDYRESLGDDTAAMIPTHITLLPPIDLDDSLLPSVTALLDRTAGKHAPFAVQLRGTGTFQPVSPVVFVGVVAGISECESLAADICQPPLAIDLAFPYHPHVTIAHHLPEDVMDRSFAEQSDFDCEFVVDQFWLYSHDVDQGWIPARGFALGGV